MTGNHHTADTGQSDGVAAGTRRARIETAHGDETATMLARALRPDNTDEMETRIEGSRLVTTIDRETTGGLQSTVDDYVVNLQTGMQVLTSEDTADSGATPDGDTTREDKQSSNHNTDSSRDTTDTDTARDTETDNE